MARKKRVQSNKPTTLQYPNTKSYISAGHSEMPFGMKPSDNPYYDSLAVDMINEIRNDPTVWDIDEWFERKGIYYSLFMQIKETNDNLKIAYDIARKSIGFKMAKLLRETAPATTAFIIPQYHDKWRDEVERRATLKANLEGKGNMNITVEMAALPALPKKEKNDSKG